MGILWNSTHKEYPTSSFIPSVVYILFMKFGVSLIVPNGLYLGTRLSYRLFLDCLSAFLMFMIFFTVRASVGRSTFTKRKIQSNKLLIHRQRTSSLQFKQIGTYSASTLLKETFGSKYKMHIDACINPAKVDYSTEALTVKKIINNRKADKNRVF